MPLSFRSAADLSIDAMAALVTRGYEGYFSSVAPDAAGLRAMVGSNNLDLSASVVAREGEADVAFAMLGIRERRGWIGGMGVVSEARGRGYAKRVMQAVLESAFRRNLVQVALEVIEQNHTALRVYQALGFQEQRWLDVFERSPGPLAARQGTSRPIVGLDVAACLDRHADFQRTRPPWQREITSIAYWGDRVQALGVLEANEIACWALYRRDPTRVVVLDLALAAERPLVLLEDTVRALVARHADLSMSLVNLPSDEPHGAILRALGAKITFRQREMVLQVRENSW